MQQFNIEPNNSQHQDIIFKVCKMHGVKSLELTTKHIALMSDCISEYISQQGTTATTPETLYTTGFEQGVEAERKKGKLPDAVVEKILKARDALVVNDNSEAYHQLYSITSPDFSSLNPWEAMELQVGYPPALLEEDIIARKECDLMHVHAGKGMRWVKASERLPEKWGKKVIVRDLRTGAVSVEKNMGHYTAWGAGFLPFKETEWLDEGSTEQSGKEESPTAAGEMDELHRKSAELHSLKQSISESRLKDYFPTRDMSFHDKVVFAIDKATAAGDGKARETIEDILLKTGKHNPEQCSELADAILRDMKGAGDGKEANEAVALLDNCLAASKEVLQTLKQHNEAIDIMLWAFTYIDEWNKKDNTVRLFNGEVRPVADLPTIFKNRSNEQK